MAFMQNLISKIITFAKYIYRSIYALIFSLIEHAVFLNIQSQFRRSTLMRISHTW